MYKQIAVTKYRLTVSLKLKQLKLWLFNNKYQCFLKAQCSNVKITAFNEKDLSPWIHSHGSDCFPGNDPLTDEENNHDINSVAGVLKMYFRNLDNPLFPKEKFNDLIACVRECLFPCDHICVHVCMRQDGGRKGKERKGVCEKRWHKRSGNDRVLKTLVSWGVWTTVVFSCEYKRVPACLSTRDVWFSLFMNLCVQ